MSDAWRYAPVFAQTKVNPDEFGTVPDWNTVRRELHAALKAAGHPAGD